MLSSDKRSSLFRLGSNEEWEKSFIKLAPEFPILSHFPPKASTIKLFTDLANYLW
jgi:hypothetical protein